MPARAGLVTAMILGHREFLDLSCLCILAPHARAVLFPPCQRRCALADGDCPHGPAVGDSLGAQRVALFRGGFDLSFEHCDLCECFVLSHLSGSYLKWDRLIALP